MEEYVLTRWNKDTTLYWFWLVLRVSHAVTIETTRQNWSWADQETVKTVALEISVPWRFCARVDSWQAKMAHLGSILGTYHKTSHKEMCCSFFFWEGRVCNTNHGCKMLTLRAERMRWYDVRALLGVIGKTWAMAIIAEGSQIPHWDMNVVFWLSTDHRKNRICFLSMWYFNLMWLDHGSWNRVAASSVFVLFILSTCARKQNWTETWVCVSSNSINVVTVFLKGHSWNLLDLVVVDSGSVKWVVNWLTVYKLL